MGVPGSNPGGPIIFRRKLGDANLSSRRRKRIGPRVGVRGPISRRPDKLNPTSDPKLYP
jgi:hypothetical protein